MEDHVVPFEKDKYTESEQELLAPFFTNLDKPVYAPLILSPEVTGALCSRTSRAADDLRAIFLREYLLPFLQPKHEDKDTQESWSAKQQYGDDLREFIAFLKEHPIERIFSNPRARSFYNTWLAQYGDDSIAQMAGMHLIYSSISQVAIKHFEDQRIGLAPLEKSTRYVDYSSKVKGQYRYYTDPLLKDLGLEKEYKDAMDGLFDTYTALQKPLSSWVANKYPEEEPRVIKTKVFDVLRGLLPTSTLSQLALYGNGQAFEYMMARSLKHPLGEIRWMASAGYEELYQVAPSFLRRLKNSDSAKSYQAYLGGKDAMTASVAEEILGVDDTAGDSGPSAKLVEYDTMGEEKVITGILYSTSSNHRSWNQTFGAVQRMSKGEKKAVLDKYLTGREQRWQKVGRAFENAYVRFEVVMNIGAWRDLHRHRMLTQQRQVFSCRHGYDVPVEIVESGLEASFRVAIDRVENMYSKIAEHDPLLAQYAVTLAHRVRFMQWENIRQCFWEMELRTIPEGHPDYRHIEQEKFRQLARVYPLISQYMRVNMGEYNFARRGQEEKIQSKLKELEKIG